MKISVFGMGYVGSVTAACLAREGHRVVGVDVSPDKVRLIQSGASPIVEAQVPELIAQQVAEGRLSATTSAEEALRETTLSIVCVGTPSLPNGDVDLNYTLRVTEQIAGTLAKKDAFHTVIYRSTLPPGTMEGSVLPALASASGKALHREYEVFYNPEFLREGSSVLDFYHPAFTVVGSDGKANNAPILELYSFLNAPLHMTSLKTAEMLKYVCNSYHALKVCFANEVGSLAKRLGLDGYELMQLFMLDTKQNLSGMYLKPGFAYGGSCLPKDVRGINYRAQRADCSLSLLGAIERSNQEHIDRAFNLVTSFGKRKVGLLGLSFKGGTDDLRESPLVLLAEKLIGKGYDLSIYDPNVKLASVVGANRAFIDKEIPHIEKLFLASAEQVVTRSEVIVIGNKSDEYLRAVAHVKDRCLVDLARAVDDPSTLEAEYHGICW